MQALIDFFGVKDLIPHGYCLSWSPVLLWLHVISDLLITLAYYSIPLMLVYFIRQRKDFPYPEVIALFAGFIVACGTTHLMSVITIWIPLYWLDGLLKAFTAIISLVTAVLMLWVIPRVLSLPSTAQLQTEIQQRKIAQMAQQEALDKLQKIASRLPGVVYQYRLRPDGSSCLPYASVAIRDIFRVNPEEVREDASKIFAILHPDDLDGVWASIYKSAHDLTSWNYEFRVRFDDGTVHWLDGNALPTREADGSTLWHGFITDITKRKQAEQILIQLKAMIDISLDGFWITDIETNLLQVNQAYAKLIGYSIDELINMDISQLEALEDPEQIKARTVKIVAQGYDQFETRHRHKDGHVIDIEISITYLPEFQRFCVFCRDITERKVMEDELKVSEAKFRSIIEVSSVPMALLNEEQSSLAYLNPAFIKTLGYNLDDIPTLDDWWLKAYPDQDYRHSILSSWQMAMEKAKQEQTDIPPLELDIHCKNNSNKTLIVSASAVHNSPGIYLVMLYDITERKQIEAKLNAIFNAAVEGIITTDMSGIIVSANTAVKTIFGYNPEELTGCSINALMPSSPGEMNNGGLPNAAKSGGQFQEVEGLHKNGSVVPMDMSLAEYSIDNAHYFTYIVRDVSLRKNREQQDKQHLDQLAHVTRLGLMGEMASGIAHEVNQPLSAISSYTQVSLNLINTENPDLVTLTEILDKTKHQALRAGRIIHRMRDFIKSHAKHRSTADINTLIHGAVELCTAELKHHGIKLTFELKNHLPLVCVDHIQIEQVIINLLRNSIDALKNMPAKQQRHLSIQSELTLKNAVEIRIKDNGPGIDEDQQQKILMPFYTTKAEGMGMGLSISRSLVEAHEGTLHFNSQPGKGSTFNFTLPTLRNPDEPIAVPPV